MVPRRYVIGVARVSARGLYGPGALTSSRRRRDVMEDVRSAARNRRRIRHKCRATRVGTARWHHVRRSASSDRQEEVAGRMEHSAPPMYRARSGRSRGEEGGTCRACRQCRRAPRPGIHSSITHPGRDRRRCRLSRAERPRAGTLTRGFRNRIGWGGQIVHQGLRQREGSVPIGSGRDEVRATGLCARRRNHAQRQERQDGSCRKRDRSLVGEGPRHRIEFLGIDRFCFGRGRQRSDRDREPSRISNNLHVKRSFFKGLVIFLGTLLDPTSGRLGPESARFWALLGEPAGFTSC